MDSSSSGDTVLVGPGTYLEDVDFGGKDITVIGRDGPELTFLNGSSEDSSVVIFRSGEGPGAVLEGFTITQGKGTAWFSPSPNRYGGGISIFNGSPTIRNNVISDNQADWGGGMFMGIESATDQPFPLPRPTVEGNLIKNNTGNHGGGGAFVRDLVGTFTSNVFQSNITLHGDGAGLRILMTAGSLTVTKNTFLENLADDQGGGLHAHTSASLGPVGPVVIEQNVFIRNMAYGHDIGDVGAGGAICASSLFGSIRRNTIVENISLGESECGGGGIRLWDESAHSASDLIIEANIIAFNSGCGISCRFDPTATFGPNLMWNNQGGDFGGSPTGCPIAWAGQVTEADPAFCDQANDDFSVAENSPALVGSEVMGAFGDPGCGPVAVLRTTWGVLKSKYVTGQ